MDVAIIKSKEEIIAFSLFPVGIVGWGKTKKDAITSIENNLYDYCNWLSKPLPKSPEADIKEEYSGEIARVKFKSDDKSLLKKYSEVVVQTAFSFKSMADGVEKTEEEQKLLENLYNELNILGGAGLIGYSADLCEKGDFPLFREFIYKVQKLAKYFYLRVKESGRDIFNTFSFDFT